MQELKNNLKDTLKEFLDAYNRKTLYEKITDGSVTVIKDEDDVLVTFFKDSVPLSQAIYYPEKDKYRVTIGTSITFLKFLLKYLYFKDESIINNQQELLTAFIEMQILDVRLKQSEDKPNDHRWEFKCSTLEEEKESVSNIPNPFKISEDEYILVLKFYNDKNEVSTAGYLTKKGKVVVHIGLVSEFLDEVAKYTLFE